MSQPIWTPSQNRIDDANITKFCAYLNDHGYGAFDDYDTLWAWSVENIDMFWSAFWEFGNIIGDKGEIALSNANDLQKAQFFPDAKVNLAENLLKKTGLSPAVISYSEMGERTEWSWQGLHDTVSSLQQALRASGVSVGDHVAGIVPNTPYAVAAALAVMSLGAVWCSCSPDFGFNSAFDRLGQINPKIIFSADGYTYNSKEFSCVETLSKLADAMPSVEKVIIFPLNETYADIDVLQDKGVHFQNYIAPFQPRLVHFERINFNDPAYIMFSSGTTGLPKCIVHSVGGTLMQHFKEHHLQVDLKDNDKLFYFTTCGWMMWNWMVSALGTGASVVLYDGSPFYPNGARFADIIEQEKVTHFGTSAKYLDACAKSNLTPIKTHKMAMLRTILSTGSPLSDMGFEYVYSGWKEDVCLSSIAGGTDILGCFVGGSPISPVFKGECQKRHLAMDVQVYDEHGQSVQEEQGELVCCAPHPSMPIGFWNDADNERYKAAYFDKYPNVWHQGDLVKLTQNNGMRYYGRSDATLNPGGVRIGTAEIYRIVESMDAIVESVVIGQNWEDDQRVVLFVKLQSDISMSQELIAEIKTKIKSNATPRHVPALILEVEDIPRTKSGKIAEIAVRDTVHGKAVKNTASLANPEALDFYKGRDELIG